MNFKLSRKRVIKQLKPATRPMSWSALAKLCGGNVSAATTKPQAKAIVKQYFKANKNSPIKQTPQEFYTSPEWRKVRYKALQRHGAACQCCGRSPQAHKIVLHVDHIKPRSKHPELELNINNLQILCEDCNLGKMADDDTDWRPLKVIRRRNAETKGNV